MKLPRDVSGAELAKNLGAILGEVAAHLKLTRDELLERLFG